MADEISDFSDFWEDSDYARKRYVERALTEELISSVESELGFRLPASYLALMRTQNGGIPRNCCFPTDVPTSWAADHVAITGIYGVGREKTYSLCGPLGATHMRDDWGYPDIGICICNCPSAGHDSIMLDYRKSGCQGEPEVVHVDQELDYKITFLAKDFAAFVRGLVHTSVYDTSAADLIAALSKIDTGSFSTLLVRVLAGSGEPGLGTVVRRICRKLTVDKGYFALHADELSVLVYDCLFYLYSRSIGVPDADAYLKAYPGLIALCDGGFTTGGYAPDFVGSWMNGRLAHGEIAATPAGNLAFRDEFLAELKRRLNEYE